MTETANISIWHLLFEQTPPLLRWLLGVLTLGLFTLAGWLYRRERQSVQRVEKQVHARMDRFEEATNQQFRDLRTDLNHRLDEVNTHLIHIARNTRRED